MQFIVRVQVTLDVDFDNGESRSYTVDPLRAALLGHFGKHREFLF